MRFFRPVPRVAAAGPDDVSDLAALLAVPPEEVAAWLRGGFEVYRATLDGRLVGCLRCAFPTGACVIDQLMVVAGDRGRGIGEYLAEHAISRARRAGASRAWIHVAVDNMAALALARKVGFREAQRHRGGGGEVVLLEMTL